MLTNIDDFEVTGKTEFVEEIISLIEKKLTVSKVENGTFRYTGLDVKIVLDGIKISMEDYSRSLLEKTEIRKREDRNESLTKLKMKMTGK